MITICESLLQQEWQTPPLISFPSKSLFPGHVKSAAVAADRRPNLANGSFRNSNIPLKGSRSVPIGIYFKEGSLIKGFWSLWEVSETRGLPQWTLSLTVGSLTQMGVSENRGP